MPTYEYRCPEGHDFERFFRKISDASAQVPCPTCGKIGERQISAGAGLLFKGSGFYLTDYGKNAHRGEPPPSAGEAKSEASNGASSGGSSGEAKSGDKKVGGDASASKPSDAKPTEAKPASAPASSSTKPGKSD